MSKSGRRLVKVPGPKSTNSHNLKMKDPTSTCSVSIFLGEKKSYKKKVLSSLSSNSSAFQYNQLYQNVKRVSKTGENFCKELMTVFQSRYFS